MQSCPLKVSESQGKEMKGLPSCAQVPQFQTIRYGTAQEEIVWFQGLWTEQGPLQ